MSDCDDYAECYEPDYDHLEKQTAYKNALIEFNSKQKYFEDVVPAIAVLPLKERATFVMTEYEKHLWGLWDKPKGTRFGIIKTDGGLEIDELKSLCAAIRIGWRLWPDYWTTFQKVLDYFDMWISDDEILRVDEDTLIVIKEIASCKKWPNNPTCGPMMTVPAAKSILYRISLAKKRSQLKGRVDGTAQLLDRMKISEFNTCNGIGCLEEETDTVKFKVCAKCKKAVYCSRKCQVVSWKLGHKAQCN